MCRAWSSPPARSDTACRWRCGMALAARHAGATHRVFCLLSDGDCKPGSTWEAILFAAHHHFDNLTAIVDYNRVQALGSHARTFSTSNRWATRCCRSSAGPYREVDGHDCASKSTPPLAICPSRQANLPGITAQTVKGKGVSFMEDTRFLSLSDRRSMRSLPQASRQARSHARMRTAFQPGAGRIGPK